MNFYDSISDYYDNIFPYDDNQVNFVKTYAGLETGKVNVLDIGTGTGKPALKLSEYGYLIDAIDYDSRMIELAAKNKHSDSLYPVFKVMDMRDISSYYKDDTYDIVFSFGNTLVHLLNNDEIIRFFISVKKLLKKSGVLLIQILNYDYILDNNIKELPLIENDKITFIRKYEPDKNGLINFNTELKIKKSGKIIKNSIKLNPLRKNDLEEFLLKSGFSGIEFFGNFNKEILKPDSLPLIVKALF